MANPESKKLAVDVLARVDKLEKEMKKAARITDQQFGHIERRGKQFESRMASYGKTAFAGFAAGATAALAPMAMFNRALNEIARADAIGKTADKVGLTTDQLQQLRHVAELAGVNVGQMDTAMQRFSRRVAQAANGSGELHAILKANNVQLRNADGSMRSQVDILRDYANLIRNAGSEQEQLLLAFKAFDTEGAALVNLFRQGSDAIDTMAQKTEEAGGVIDEKLIRRAEELNDKLTILWRDMGVNSANAILTAADHFDTLISKANEFGNSSFFRRLAEIAGVSDAVFVPGQGVFNPGTDELTPDARIAAAFQGEQAQADAELVEALKQRYGQATKEAAQTIIPDTGGGGGGRGGSRNASAEAAAREVERVLDVIEALRLERDMIGATAVERATANALRQAGAAATAEQKQAITDLVAAIYAERDATERAAEATRELRDIGKETMGSFISDMIRGKSAADALADALTNIGNRLLSSGLDALFSGFLGGFGSGGFTHTPGVGLFAEGGFTGPGGKHEPKGIVHGGEYVFSKKAVQRAGVANLEAMHRSLKGYSDGGLVTPAALSNLSVPRPVAPSGGSTNVPINIEIDARGADREGLVRVEMELARLKRDIPATIINMVRDRPNKRW